MSFTQDVPANVSQYKPCLKNKGHLSTEMLEAFSLIHEVLSLY